MAAVPGPARPTAAAPAGGFVGEGQGDFDLGVLGEGLGARQVEGAAGPVHAVVGRAERVAGAVAVAEQEIGGIHQHAAVAFGRHGEAPEHGLGE